MARVSEVDGLGREDGQAQSSRAEFLLYFVDGDPLGYETVLRQLPGEVLHRLLEKLGSAPGGETRGSPTVIS